MRALAVLGLLGVLAATAVAEEAALPPAFAARLAADRAAGRPLTVEVHVALCEQSIIACGNARLGDGDSLATNLYWASSGGLRGWFERRHSGWERLAIVPGHRPEILETRIYRRHERGGELVVVAHAWRGKMINEALDAWVADLTDGRARRYALGEGRVIEGGGRAAVVAYVGHNGWMDRSEAPFPRPVDGSAAQGAIAIACRSAEWLAGERARGALIDTRSDGRRVPLLLTADLLFAGSHALEGAIVALARGGDLAAIRDGAAASYALGEGKSAARVRSAFTNPSDPRWERRR